MFYINKIVGWMMSPMGALFLGIALGIGLRSLSSARRLRCLGNWVIGLALAFFWIMSCAVTTRWIGVPLEGEEVDTDHSSFITYTSSARCDAIVLLGGGMGAHEKCGRPEMFSGADRVWMAARMWHACSKKGDGEDNGEHLKMPITLSGGGVRQSTVPYLKDLGIPEEAMMFFPEARNTEEEARLIYEKLSVHSQPRPLTPTFAKPKVLLVTSAWHMPRAKMLFERAGFDVVAAPTDYEMHYVAEESLKIRHFFPSADALHRNSDAVKEWVARAGYSLFRRQ